jgi:hypothetical protein
MNPILARDRFAGRTIELVAPGKFEVRGWLTESMGRLLLGYTPHETGELLAVVTSRDSARAAMPRGLVRVPTAKPTVEIWL